ncbi:MAG TPA: sigma-70 family RNA polymerase sigma factor [Thermoanaerobaculia bacterium]|nr:sigma-70 family RNA polymerase sigma factor [Thermoanaerobaculia bacterium]
MTESGNDRRLAALIGAGDDDAEREIERLILDEARPLAEKILRRYTRSNRLMRAEDAEDVAAGIGVRLLEKLRAVRHSHDEAIQDFDAYVAMLTYNAISDHLRRRFPERARLKRRLRYALSHDVRLAMWGTSAGAACGLRAWKGAEDALDAIPDDVAPHEGLDALFRATGKPVLFNAVVSYIARTSSIANALVDEEQASLAPSPADVAETRDFVRALWREILELPPMQRKALLLNLRYGGEMNVIALLVMGRIVTFNELAASLEMQARELAAVWNRLPLDDLQLAALLGITRQQVINLRKSARERLSRKLPR